MPKKHNQVADALKKHDGKLIGALVTNVRDTAENSDKEKDALTIVVDIGEDVRVDAEVQVDPDCGDWKPERGDFVDIIADTEKGDDDDTLPTVRPTETADVEDEGASE